jgi:hypothetical protein
LILRVLKHLCSSCCKSFLGCSVFQILNNILTCQLINWSAFCLYYFCLVIVKCHFCVTLVLFNNLFPKSYFPWAWLIVFSFLVFVFYLVLTILAFMLFFSFVVCMILLDIKRHYNISLLWLFISIDLCIFHQMLLTILWDGSANLWGLSNQLNVLVSIFSRKLAE